MTGPASTQNSITAVLLARLRLWLAFLIIQVICTFGGSGIAIAITGERGYGGLGLVVALPLGQVAYGLFVARLGVWLGLGGAVLATVSGYLGAETLVEVYHVRLVHDFYGVFDLLVLFGLISLAWWEGLYWLAHAWRTRAAAREEGR